MTQEERNELKRALHIMQWFALYRRGYCNNHEFYSGKEIGVALDAVMGCVYDYVVTDNDLRQQLCIAKSQESFIGVLRKENTRLKALCASHKVKYGKGEK
jgi:hypothetical protein